jgi:SecDF, P1 head subdomain
MNRKTLMQIAALIGAALVLGALVAFGPEPKGEAEAPAPSGPAPTPEETQTQVKALVERVRDAKTDAERKSAEQELRNLLGRYFDRDIQRREQELTSLEERMNKLRNLLATRKEAKDSIVDLQYRVLVNEAKGLALFEGDLTNSLNAVAPGAPSSAENQWREQFQRRYEPRQRYGGPVGPEPGEGSTAIPENISQHLVESDLVRLMSALRLYADDHGESFPKKLDDIVPILRDKGLGGEGLLDQITSRDGADALIYIWSPGPVSPQERPVLIAATPHGSGVALANGSVSWRNQSPEAILSQELQRITKEQPGTKAVMATGSDLQPEVAMKLSLALDRADIPVTRADKIAAAKRIRIELLPPAAKELTQVEDPLLQDLRRLMLGMKMYEADHQSFPDTLNALVPTLQNKETLDQITSQDGAKYLVYVQAPRQGSPEYPQRPVMIVAAASGTWVGLGDGSVWHRNQSVMSVLAEELQKIVKEQPGTRAYLFVGDGLPVGVSQDLLAIIRAEVSWYHVETSPTALGKPAAKTIRIALRAPVAPGEETIDAEIPAAQITETKISHQPVFQMRLAVPATPDSAPPVGWEKMELSRVNQSTGQTNQEVLYVGPRVLLDQRDIEATHVTSSQTSGRPEIAVTFTEQGRQHFAEVTRESIGKRLAIIINGQIYSAPVIRTEISGGKAQITGDFTAQEAKDLSNQINEALR